MHTLLDARGRPIGRGKPVFDEVASLAKEDIASAFVGELRDVRDEILRAAPGGIDAYKRLLTDDQVYATYQQRRRAITSREWSVEPGGPRRADRRAADWLKETLMHVGWDRVVERMHFGVFYGYAVAELMYGRDGRYVALDQIRVRDRKRFRFDRDGLLRLITPTDRTRGELMPPRKFWYFSTGGDHDDDPYGMGLAHYLYWPVWFKRNGVKFWLIFLEKFGAPTPVGKYEPGTSDPEKRKLLQGLAALTADAGMIYPKTMEVELLEASRSGRAGYELLYDKMNEAISKVNLSQTMTTDQGSSEAQARVHEEVAETVQKSDSGLICGSFNGGTPWSEAPVAWLTQWNFPGASPPEVRYNFEEEEDLNTRAERDTKIAGMGFAPSQKYIQETYGGEWTSRQGREGEMPPSADAADDAPVFAEPLPSASAAAAFTRRALAETAGMDEMIAPLLRRLEAATSLEEFRDVLFDAYAEMPSGRFGALLQRALLSAELAGRYEVREAAADGEVES